MIKYNLPKLLLKSGKEMNIPNDWVDSWCVLYGTDYTLYEIKKACQWSLDNPTKRKTQAGARRFFGSWLMRNEGSRQNTKTEETLKGKYGKR